jgi:hypothetical protein
MTTEIKALDFAILKTAVGLQFLEMQKYPLFRVELGSEQMWETYLGSFPTGTNPLYRERTLHDCSACRHFIRDIGNVVALTEDGYMTIWDYPTDEPAYNDVCRAMGDLVRSCSLNAPFMHDNRTSRRGQELRADADGAQTWEHFHVKLPAALVKPKAEIPTLLGEKRATHDVLLRGLLELTMDSMDTFLDLVAQGSLYRGEEHKPVVERFRALKFEFDGLSTDNERDQFAWVKAQTESAAINRLRNTAVGTLLIDLSNGVELETAVTSFERMVAPTNYKRPTALVTKAMVEDAKKKIDELGLSSALDRRFAVMEDVSINNVLFADRQARRVLTGDVFDDLVGELGDRTPKNLDKVEEVPIDKFLSEVLPRVDTIEVLVENRHAGNFVSLVAPSDPESGQLFKWPNRFSWTYAGEVADSIKERVKRAGGDVSGDLSCRLAWSNYDDLDLHMREQGSRDHIYYAQKGPSRSGGRLDVDMNAGGRMTKEPVENIFYKSRSTMKEGIYELSVNQYCRRESDHDGFEVEVDWMGTTYSFATDKSPRQGSSFVVATMEYSRANGIKMLSGMEAKNASRLVWGVPTEAFRRVSVMMLSPNYWDEKAVGNKHYFFLLDGCVNDGAARGFYNEFLTPELDKHRKVFELVGSKLQMAPADQQLSGLGFSSTQRSSLVCRVKGSFTRTIKIIF